MNGGTGAIGRLTTSGSLSEYLLSTLPATTAARATSPSEPTGTSGSTWVTLDPAQPLAT